MPPYTNIRFDWLEADEPEEPQFPFGGRRDYRLPNGYGEGCIETIELALGMTMFRAEHRFAQSASSRTVEVGDIAVEMQEPSLQAQVMRGGRALETQVDFSETVQLSAGTDLFRYSTKYRLTAALDCSSDSQMTCLSIGETTLSHLIGKEEAGVLRASLGLLSLPSFTTRPIPLGISQHLHNSMLPTLTGAARKLSCQARALDYLTALLQHLNLQNNGALSAPARQTEKLKRERIERVHEYLLGLEGKLPTLDAISQQFGVSARALNDDFTAQFGLSITAFITNRRLMAAHELIKSTDIALKTVSHRLGYAHVNHFIAAFKRKFGYPPGALRKGPQHK